MNKLFPLIIIATLANILTIILDRYENNRANGEGAAIEFTLGVIALWLLVPLTAVILRFIYRKELFKRSLLIWSLVTLFFCTPIPITIAYNVTHPTPEETLVLTGYNVIGRNEIKTEDWNYTSPDRRAISKYFIADTSEYNRLGESAFKRDSTWIYFSKSGDTIKIEH